MNDTGPEAVPPPLSRSRDERIVDRLVPVPDPCLNRAASVAARPSTPARVSSTLLMKHAEHCGCSVVPTLNHTGELKDARWVTRIAVSSASKASASAGERK